MDTVSLHTFTPDDAEWLIDQHAALYASDEGFDATFGTLVSGIVEAFIAHHDPGSERGWIAWQGARRVGSIFCVRHDDTSAKLRLFLITPEARGIGLGHRLLDTCMAFARDCGYARMQLWTHESHRAACALYAAHGWRLTASRPVRSFGVDLVEQSWEIDL
ncbi:GNAT family N-acetyltransferase [Sediminimonas sp.]|uniref:GNAT family N-acetyltransferase n=1 Tax=Sediminimonas sp. TaxID=2823379 RepID=UPI0025E924BD|nr:GNAT family N-acetyltransferase [Sediminimonas sp.]